MGHALASHFEWYELLDRAPFHQELQNYILHKVSLKNDPSKMVDHRRTKERFQIGYVMKGAQISLEKRLPLAGRLYRSKVIKELLISRRPGITAYEPEQGRNLSNDEWTIKELRSLGVDDNGFSLITMKEGTFGTLSEIKQLLHYCHRAGFERIAIISSDYHTRRIELTLTYLDKDPSIEYGIFGAPDTIAARELFIEWCKLVSYRYIILPIFALIEK